MKILNTGLALLCFITALFAGSTFINASPVSQDAMEWLVAGVIVLGLFSLLIIGITWVAGMLQSAVNMKQKKRDEL
jgi:uncharacterized membrane protein YdbT with pleckstrin-like domain